MTKLTRRHATALLAVAPLALASRAQGATHKVEISNMKFSPTTLTIKAGDTVSWKNKDRMPHTATAKNKAWTTASLGNGSSGTVTFDEKGTHAYICRFHPGMKGKVVVT